MHSINDYKPLESKSTQPTSAQDWAVRLAQLLTEHTEALPEDVKAHLGNYRNAIAILANDVLRKALASQRIAIMSHLNSQGHSDAASTLGN
jgi:hypothetical protein